MDEHLWNHKSSKSQFRQLNGGSLNYDFDVYFDLVILRSHHWLNFLTNAEHKSILSIPPTNMDEHLWNHIKSSKSQFRQLNGSSLNYDFDDYFDFGDFEKLSFYWIS